MRRCTGVFLIKVSVGAHALLPYTVRRSVKKRKRPPEIMALEPKSVVFKKFHFFSQHFRNNKWLQQKSFKISTSQNATSELHQASVEVRMVVWDQIRLSAHVEKVPKSSVKYIWVAQCVQLVKINCIMNLTK